MTDPGRYTVSFDDDIPDRLEFGGVDNISFVPDIGWGVEVDFPGVGDFVAGLSVINSSGVMSGNFGVVHSPTLVNPMPGVNWLVSSNGFYLSASTKNSAGFYALSEQPDIRLTNFFVPGIDHSTRFEIPDITKYSRVELLVFDRLEKQIFKSNNYFNELDVRDFPGGTYFYDLTLYEGGNKRVIHNFIEVRHVK